MRTRDRWAIPPGFVFWKWLNGALHTQSITYSLKVSLARSSLMPIEEVARIQAPPRSCSYHISSIMLTSAFLLLLAVIARCSVRSARDHIPINVTFTSFKRSQHIMAMRKIDVIGAAEGLGLRACDYTG
eukprot:2068068-Pleurochrysis_carterae.AAC.2